MCGIFGLVDNYNENLIDLDKVKQSIQRRGPDHQGQWFSENKKVKFLHTRLSILDLSKNGNQPMMSSNGKFIITYNGEIYNFHKLKKKIENEKNFMNWKSNSDTEVLIELINNYGLEKAVKLLDGMFSFGLYDKKNNKVYLVRDRFGEKPLYYGYINKTFFFSSDLSFIKMHNFSSMTSLNYEAINLMAKYSYIPTPLTIYKNIFKLEPGTILKINLSSNLSFNKINYFENEKSETQLKSNDLIDFKEEDLVNYLEKTLNYSVKNRMISDVPIGCFLSGGLDSSLIAALMQKNNNKKIKTFSIGQSDERFNELKYARDIASYLGTEHYEFKVDGDDLLNVIENSNNVYSEPFADSSQIPSVILSNKVRQHVKVALSGDCGDELFGGYNRYLYYLKYGRLIISLPKLIKLIISKTFSSIKPQSYNAFLNLISKNKNVSYNFGDKFHKGLEKLQRINSSNDFYYSMISEWEDHDNIFITKSKNDPVNDYINSISSVEFLNKMMTVDKKYYMSDDILCKVDRASMYSSLETRVPFLSKEISNFSDCLSSRYKIRDGKSKYIIRKVLEKHIPLKLIDRPKMGFSIPLDNYLRNELKSWANDLINSKSLYDDYFEIKKLKRLWKEHLYGSRNWTTKLWPILTFISWRRFNK